MERVEENLRKGRLSPPQPRPTGRDGRIARDPFRVSIGGLEFNRFIYVREGGMTQFVVAGAALLLGMWLIYVGLMNIRTRVSEESGVRRRVNHALGESNTYTGGKAALQGWIRVGMGMAAIVFAVWFVFLGPEA